MTVRKVVPSDIEAERLADLLADARAIPTAAFERGKGVAAPVIDLTAIPTQRRVMRIPEAAASLIADADHHFVGYRG